MDGIGETGVGLALGPRRVVAVTVRRTLRGPRPDRVRRRELERGPDADGWPGLREALEDLREEELPDDGRRPLRLHVALLPPLSRSKVVDFPAAGRKQLRRLAGREVERHFLDPPEDPLADAAPASPSLAGRGSAACVVGCASEGDVRSLLDAVRDAGCRAGLVAPAAWTLVEGALELDPELRRGRRRLPLDGPGRGREVLVEDGIPAAVRPASPEPADGGTDGLAPPALAAFGALLAPEDGPLLLPEEARRRWRRRGTRRTALLAVLAALLAAAGGVLHLWGLDREIRAVEARRSAHAASVARATARREAALRLRELLTALDSLRPRGVGWTRLLSAVGRRLPSSAYLETLEEADGAVRITGRSRSPSALIPRLEASPVVEAARLESVTRSAGPGEGETFRIVLSPEAPADGAGGASPPRDPAGDDSTGDPARPPPGTGEGP